MEKTKHTKHTETHKEPVRIKLSWVILAVVILLAAGYAYAHSKPKVNYDEFAQCLTEKGAVMYGAYWCSHCKAQKEQFGESFQYVNYVECTEDKLTCIEKGIEGFPTWIIEDTKYTGVQSMERLSSVTQCELPE